VSFNSTSIALYLDGIFFLVYEIKRHIAIAMQQVIVDISQKMCLLIQRQGKKSRLDTEQLMLN
jgi:hypothetical protein